MMPFGMSPEATLDYDEQGRVIHANDPKSHLEVWCAYDEEGRMSQVEMLRPAAASEMLCYDCGDGQGAGEKELEVGS
jgi:YD repeat-containing protein